MLESRNRDSCSSGARHNPCRSYVVEAEEYSGSYHEKANGGGQENTLVRLVRPDIYSSLRRALISSSNISLSHF